MLRSSRSRTAAVTLAAAAALTVPPSTTAAAGPDDPGSDGLQEQVTLSGVLDHVEAFQDIADANDGNRAAGLPGYDASADYVAEEMREAGYAGHAA